MNSNERYFDVVIVGGGASGLAAAAAVKRKRPELKVAVSEAQRRAGRKLLATGNGRCNLTNLNIRRENYIGSFDPEGLLERYTPRRLIDFFSSLGLLCSAEPTGLVYPLCRQASAVLNVLICELDRRGVEIICGSEITSVNRTENGFALKSEGGGLAAKNVIIASGGKASPSLGGSGSGLELLRALGHKIIEPRPCLTPIEVRSDLIKPLKGIRCKAELSLFDGDSFICGERGEVQFSEKALSGICVFNLSSRLGGLYRPIITVDLLPDYSEKEIYSMLLKRREIFAQSKLDGFFTGMLQKMIGLAVLKSAGVTELSKSCAALSDRELKALCRSAKGLSFRCNKPESFSKAQAMSGGVSGDEIDPETFESRLVKGLYVCGEVLDICGDCGGFNLHFAFSSGLAAGGGI